MLGFPRRPKTYQYQNERSYRRTIIGWPFYADNSKDVVEGLKKSRHNNHPAVSLAVNDCLHDMTAGGKSEKDGEEIGSCD